MFFKKNGTFFKKNGMFFNPNKMGIGEKSPTFIQNDFTP